MPDELGDDTAFLSGALGQAGLDAITNIDDVNERAFWCRVYWPPLRKALLRLAHWNFAEELSELALNFIPPQFGFTSSFALPSNLLKIREYNGATPDWRGDNWMYWSEYYRIVGRNLFTNDTQVKITYTKDVTNPDLWDALFYQTAEGWLASKLARQPGKNPAKSKELFESVIGLLLPLGLSVDGQEGSTIAYIVDDLIRGR